MLIGFERIYHDCIENRQKSTYPRFIEWRRRSGVAPVQKAVAALRFLCAALQGRRE